MGTKMGPSHANLFVGYIESQFFNQFNGTKPELYGRHIDDCIGATSSSREELDHFITVCQLLSPGTEIFLGNFRNVNRFSRHQSFNQWQRPINQWALQTYTDSHSYLLHSSSHPSHVKNSIPFSISYTSAFM